MFQEIILAPAIEFPLPNDTRNNHNHNHNVKLHCATLKRCPLLQDIPFHNRLYKKGLPSNDTRARKKWRNGSPQMGAHPVNKIY